MQEKTGKERIFVLLFDGSKFFFQLKKKKIPERRFLPRRGRTGIFYFLLKGYLFRGTKLDFIHPPPLPSQTRPADQSFGFQFPKNLLADTTAPK